MRTCTARRRAGRYAFVGLITAAIAIVAPATPSDATVLCAAINRTTGLARDGATPRLRSVCRSSEVQLDAAALGIRTLSGVVVRTGTTISAAGSLATPANCAAGELATGGGVVSSATGGAEVNVRSSRPQPEEAGATPTGWRISAINENAPTGQITVTPFAVCATP